MLQKSASLEAMLQNLKRADDSVRKKDNPYNAQAGYTTKEGKRSWIFHKIKGEGISCHIGFG